VTLSNHGIGHIVAPRAGRAQPICISKPAARWRDPCGRSHRNRRWPIRRCEHVRFASGNGLCATHPARAGAIETAPRLRTAARQQRPIRVIGDAIASFAPRPVSRQRCRAPSRARTSTFLVARRPSTADELRAVASRRISAAVRPIEPIVKHDAKTPRLRWRSQRHAGASVRGAYSVSKMLLRDQIERRRARVGHRNEQGRGFHAGHSGAACQPPPAYLIVGSHEKPSPRPDSGTPRPHPACRAPSCCRRAPTLGFSFQGHRRPPSASARQALYHQLREQGGRSGVRGDPRPPRSSSRDWSATTLPRHARRNKLNAYFTMYRKALRAPGAGRCCPAGSLAPGWDNHQRGTAPRPAPRDPPHPDPGGLAGCDGAGLRRQGREAAVTPGRRCSPAARAGLIAGPP